MNMRPKVMICYSDAGNGPLRASEALADALNAIYGNSIEVTMVDILKKANTLGFQTVRLYNYLLTKNLIWNTLALRMFYRSDLVKSGALLKHSVNSMIRLIADEGPDVLVFTNPWIIGYVMRAVRKLKNPKPKAISMLIDLGCELLPPSWFNPDVDIYIAPTYEAKEELIRLGAAQSRILVLGMPISLNYVSRSHRIKSAPGGCDMCRGKPHLLVMAGRAGTRNTFAIVKGLIDSRIDSHLTVLCGYNDSLKRKIQDYYYLFRLQPSSSNIHLQLFGYESDSYSFMKEADIIITKPGALTVSEAVSLGKSLILDTYPAIMGQEAGNVKYVESRGLGLIAQRPNEVPKLVSTILKKKTINSDLCQRDESIAGTIEIAKLIGSMTSSFGMLKKSTQEVS
jgi:processive 1,2-diacylglycerol beta-glucosyltransferase